MLLNCLKNLCLSESSKKKTTMKSVMLLLTVGQSVSSRIISQYGLKICTIKMWLLGKRGLTLIF